MKHILYHFLHHEASAVLLRSRLSCVTKRGSEVNELNKKQNF